MRATLRWSRLEPPVARSAQENVFWKAELPGPGTSSQVVLGARIFLTCYGGYSVPGKERGEMKDLQRLVVGLNRADGKILWTKRVESVLPDEEMIREDHGYASSTPALDGGRVYVFFGKSGVFAFDHEGNQLWRTEVGSGTSGWGSAASPVLHGDLVIVNASVESESLVALKKRTGEVAWRAAGIKEAWNTPLLAPTAGGKLELVVGMPRKLLAFDPDDGNPLWSCDHGITWYICPSLSAHDGIVYLIGGRSGGGAAVRTGGRGDVTKSHLAWKINKGSNVSSPVFHDGHLYFAHENLGIVYCVEARTGTIVYEERLQPSPGQICASPVLADGRLYYLSRGGSGIVLSAKPKFEQLARNALAGDRSTFNATPALTGNRLLLRSDRFLYCIGKK